MCVRLVAIWEPEWWLARGPGESPGYLSPAPALAARVSGGCETSPVDATPGPPQLLQLLSLRKLLPLCSAGRACARQDGSGDEAGQRERRRRPPSPICSVAQPCADGSSRPLFPLRRKPATPRCST